MQRAAFCSLCVHNVNERARVALCTRHISIGSRARSISRGRETGKVSPLWRDERRFVSSWFPRIRFETSRCFKEAIESNSRHASPLFMSLTSFHPRRSSINIRCVSTADHLIVSLSLLIFVIFSRVITSRAHLTRPLVSGRSAR